MTGAARTVLGDVPADRLGVLDYHEHLFQVSPLLRGDELADEAASGVEAALLRDSGFSAMVEATPTALGRDPAATARIAARTGLAVVATTGAHHEHHYGDGHWLTELTERELADRFLRDLTVGIPDRDVPEGAGPAHAPDGRPVRAGLAKAGIGYWSISAFEHRVLAAVAAAHLATAAPVMVHLEHGSAAFEVLEVLESLGVRADAVVLAHIDRNPDPVLHAELAAAGAYLGYDGFSRSRIRPDSDLIACAVAAAEAGATGRLLIGGDVARSTRYEAYGGMPGLAYLGRRVLPRLVAAGGAAFADALTRENPARLLGRF